MKRNQAHHQGSVCRGVRQGVAAVLLLACVAVFAMGPGARSADAGPSDEMLKLLRMLLNSRHVEGLQEFLDETIKSVLAEDPEAACGFCGLVEESIAGLARGKNGAENGKSLLATQRDVMGRLQEDHADSPLSVRAKAYALCAQARFELARETFSGTGPWEECAKLCMEASRRTSGEESSEHIASAARYLAEGHPHAGERAPELLGQARQVVEAGLEKKPGDPELTAALSNVLVRQAEHFVAGKKKADAKKALEQAMALVKPEGDVPIGREGDRTARAYNEIIVFAAENKVRVKGETINRQRKLSGWTICYPRGLGWDYSMGGSGGQTMFTLSRTYPQGRAFIIMEGFDWDTNYTSDGGQAGGDNVGGIMDQNQEQALVDFQDIKKRRKKMGGKLNRLIKKTTGYEIQGTDEDGKPVYVRGYYFKGDHHRRTFGLEVWLYGDVSPKDAQLDFILGDIKEREKK